MKIVFFGSSEFAVESLRALVERCQVAAVFTQPDRKKGRHLHISETPVKAFAFHHGLPVFQPQDVNAPETAAQLAAYNADLFVVVSFGQKLSAAVLAAPKRFCINVHSSLLPRWRGAAPINRALISGDAQSGVTIMRMNEYMDRGDSILSRNVPITADDDALTLTATLACLGSRALLDAIEAVDKGTARFTPQDESAASVAKKLKKKDGLIHWPEAAVIIRNQVRGLIPWPCAYTYYKGMLIKVLKASVAPRADKALPGQVVAIEKKQGIVVAAGEGALLIETLQSEGKRAMSAYDFVPGHHLRVGDMLG